MIPAKDDGKDRSLMHMADRFGDLVKTLLDVCRNDVNVSDINHCERLHQIDAHRWVIARSKQRHTPDGLGSPTRPGAKGGSAVQWDPHNRHVLAAKQVHVFQERNAHKPAFA